MAVITIYFDVTFDEDVIDPETLTQQLAAIFDNALSTPGVVEELDPQLGVGIWEYEDA